MSFEERPPDALEPDHLLLWYKIERVLGEGGFGITYLAHDAKENKTVAIKEYLPSKLSRRQNDYSLSIKTQFLSDFETGLKRFINEAKTIATLAHPNIVKVTIFGCANVAMLLI